ncbi:DUF898 family protein [Dechloromonas sp. ARDL1]|uniref:DUF898 family protein n=1 Tax=Dechloromonas sp. ARDL1 TaxID=3322121 RepID=UPI003DA77D80
MTGGSMQALAANYYELLGIGQKATLDEIKAAYARQLAEFRDMLARREPPPVESLDALREAFKTLSDPQARVAYDAELDDMPPLSALPTEPPVAVPHTGGGGEERFEFLGEGGEYFRIWIVNIFLTIVTLGIYSAWAKVRREQYFHRNLMLDGSGFDYHGKPAAILKGRLVALLLVGGLSAAQHFSPLAYGVALLCLVPVVPWLAVKAFRFRAFNTSYRGLRFSFHGTYGQAFKVFVGYGFLAMVTLWLAFPVFYRQLRKFILDNTHFGNTAFNCSVTTGAIYRIFLFPGFIILALFAAIILIAVMSAGGGTAGLAAAGFVFLLIPLLLILPQVVLVPYIAARSNNAVWSATTLGPHRFGSNIPVGGFIGLTVVNWLCILCTLGLFIPWAKVRVARYRAEYLTLAVDGSLDDFVAGEAAAATAVGDEAAEMFDLDIGL